MATQNVSEQIDSAILAVVGHVKAQQDPQKCMLFSQSILNLANAKAKYSEVNSASGSAK